MTVATFLFFLGVVLLIGPKVVDGFLITCSAIVPTTMGTTIYLMVLIIGNVVISTVFRSTFMKKSTDKQRERSRRIRLIVNIIMIAIHTLSILSIVLVILNAPFTMLCEKWQMILLNNSKMFAILRWTGLILVCVSLGYLAGNRKKNKPNKPKKKRVKKTSKKKERQKEDSFFTCHYDDVEVIDSFPRVVRDSDVKIHLPRSAKKQLS